MFLKVLILILISGNKSHEIFLRQALTIYPSK